MRNQFGFTSFDWIITGLALHSLGGIFFYSSKSVCYTLCGFGLVIILLNSVFLIQHQKPFKGIVLSLFSLYLFWSVFIILRPFINEAPLTTEGFSMINQYTWLSFITPLIVFVNIKQVSLKTIFKFSFIQGLIGIVLLILNYHNIFGVNHNLDTGSDEYQDYIGLINLPVQFLSSTSFMILCYTFVSPRYRTVGFLTVFLSALITLFAARRGAAFINLLVLLFAFYLYVFGSKKNSRGFRLILVSTLIISGIALFYLYASSVFSLLFARLDEDTRAGVEDYFFYSFKGQTLDWIIGRGITGTYFCPIFASPNRGMIETGYLHIILKGGIIYLSLFVFFLAHSAYLGFFKTKNVLTKAMALYLIVHIVYLLPYGLPAFNFEYLVVWISVLYCQSKEFRMCSDTEIKMYLNFS